MAIKPINKNLMVCRVKRVPAPKGCLLGIFPEHEPFYFILAMSNDLDDTELNVGDAVYLNPRYLNEISEDTYLIPYNQIFAYLWTK